MPSCDPDSSSLLSSLIPPATLDTTERTLSEWRITGRGPKYIRAGRRVFYRPESSKNKGTFNSASDGQATVGSFGADWILDHSVTVKPSTAHSEESGWRVHVEPKWGARKIASASMALDADTDLYDELAEALDRAQTKALGW